MESHIEGCEACRRELESLEATVKLLHRVSLISPPRSFAIAEVAPRRHSVAFAFGTLRVATAVAVLALVFLFVSDGVHLFEGGLIGERLAQQVTPVAGDGLDGGEVPAEGGEYVWPVSEIEMALLGVVLVLGGTTAILWHRRRRGGEKAPIS